MDVEVKLSGAPWRTVCRIRQNRNVLMRVPLDERPVSAVRLTVLGSADGQFSRIVHVDLLPHPGKP